MNKITASGSGRLLQCSGHPRLPWLRETSEAATEGTRLHAIMETMDQAVAMNDDVRAEPLCRLAWEYLEDEVLRTMGEIIWTRTERALILDTQTRTARTALSSTPSRAAFSAPSRTRKAPARRLHSAA